MSPKVRSRFGVLHDWLACNRKRERCAYALNAADDDSNGEQGIDERQDRVEVRVAVSGDNLNSWQINGSNGVQFTLAGGRQQTRRSFLNPVEHWSVYPSEGNFSAVKVITAR